jgi:hypothetical protein
MTIATDDFLRSETPLLQETEENSLATTSCSRIDTADDLDMQGHFRQFIILKEGQK